MFYKLILKATILLGSLIFTVSSSAQTTQPQPAVYNQKLQSASLLFMENKGQVADDKSNLQPDILFTANSAGAKVYLSANTIHYQFTKTEYPKGYDPHKREPAKNPQQEAELQKQIKQSTHRFTVELKGANLHPTITTEKESAYTENYYLAQCPNGIIGVHGYEKITYKNVYPNIDWVMYSKGGFMEYDFLVHPGGNPEHIELKVKDAESVSITAAGELLMKTSLGEVKEKAPVSFVDGKKIETHFKNLGDGTIGFDVRAESGKELRIDPSIVWSTYYGGPGLESDGHCASDNHGNVYLTSRTGSSTGISSGGGFQTNINGNKYDVFVAKFNNNGNRIWATYYGGSDQEHAQSCTTDGSGNVYIAGVTSSTDVIAAGGFQNTYAGSDDAFIAKFSGSGARIWGTYCGGSGYEADIHCCTDSNNNVYLSGTTSSSTGIAAGGFQNTLVTNGLSGVDAFLVKINSTGNRLWGTYYGGESSERGSSCATDAGGNVYLAGKTNSSAGVASGGFQNTHLNGTLNEDAFLVKLDGSGSRLWATYYGGILNDWGRTCSTDKFGNVFLAGETWSTIDIASNGFQMNKSGDLDGFIIQFDSNGNRLWGSYYGGTKREVILSCSTDGAGSVYITGLTESTSNIYFNGFQNTYQGTNDVFIAKISNCGDLVWSSYFGGNANDVGWSCAADPFGNVFISGYTSSTSGIALGGYQNQLNTHIDCYLSKIDATTISSVPTAPLISTIYDTVCTGAALTLKITSGNLNSATFWQWRKDSCNGTPVDTGTSISVTPSTTTTYYVRGEGGCIMPGLCGSITINVKAGPVASFSISDSIGCGSLPVSFNNTTQNALLLQWNFGDGTSAADSLPQPHMYMPGNYTVTLEAANDICSTTASKTIRVLHSPVAAFSVSPIINTPVQLSSALFQFTNASQNANRYLWRFSNTDSASSQNPVHIFTSTGNYYVNLYAYNSLHCVDSVTHGPLVVIADVPLQIPNAFSPNGDGINDKWLISGLQGNVNNSVNVFNRWGQLVFTSIGYNKPWDGSYKGKTLPVDTYYYIINVNNKSYNGSVMLLR